MLIDASSPSSADLTRRLSSQLANARDAAAPFNPGSSRSAATPVRTVSSEPVSARAALLKTLNDYIDKGPIAAMRERILKSMDLTEEKLKTKSPEEQKAIEEEIARKIKEMLMKKQGEPSPQQAAVSMSSLYGAVSSL